MKFKAALPERFFAALQAAGMPGVPAEFSVVPRPEIAKFIRVFDTVTAREPWRAAALKEAPAIAQLRRSEVCFFSAWDFHLPPEGGCQFIEFNDNSSGFLFAAIINDLHHEVATLGDDKSLAPPAKFSAFNRRIGELAEQEARSLLREAPSTCFSFSMIPNHCSVASSAQNLCCSVISSAWRGGGLNLGGLRRLSGPDGNCCSIGTQSHSSSLAQQIFPGSPKTSPHCGGPTRRAGSMSRPIPSAMPRATTNGYWNGCRCRIGIKIWESSSRNVKS